MAKVPPKIITTIKKMIKESEKDNIKIEEAYLFGSYAKGTQHEWSDIDVALVSNDFIGNRILDNQNLANAILNSSIDIQSHPYRPEDFNQDNPFIAEIMKHAIRIL